MHPELEGTLSDAKQKAGVVLEKAWVDFDVRLERITKERDRALEEVNRLRASNLELSRERDTAFRHREMFRRALYTYLQERDRPSGEHAGIHAPTPETLREIRRLVAEIVA